MMMMMMMMMMMNVHVLPELWLCHPDLSPLTLTYTFF